MPTDESRFMEPLLLAGRLIMENGGETYRVEETITRMGRAFGLSEVESFAVPSGLFVSYRRGDGGTETAVKRVHKGPGLSCAARCRSSSRIPSPPWIPRRPFSPSSKSLLRSTRSIRPKKSALPALLS